MKYPYHFINGDIQEIEVEDAWGRYLLASDRRESMAEKKSHRFDARYRAAETPAAKEVASPAQPAWKQTRSHSKRKRIR